MVSPSPGPTLDIAVAAADNADTISRPLIVNKEVTIKKIITIFLGKQHHWELIQIDHKHD